MKHTLRTVFLTLLLLVGLTACGAERPQSIVSSALGVDASAGTVLSHAETHGGFHGDGYTAIALTFADDTLLDQLEASPLWEPFPLSPTVEALMDRAASFLRDGFSADGGEPPVLHMKDGYFFLLDRHPSKEGHILERGSYNYTLGLYDRDHRTLYCFALDT